MFEEVKSVTAIAHELKTPLCLMRQLALSLDLATTPDQRSRMESRLIQISDHTLRQIEDLERMSRLQDGLFTMEPVSIRGVCDSVLREITLLSRLEGCRIHTSYLNKTRLASANRDLLHSIVYHLCLNALHYTNDNSCSELSVSEHKGHVRVGIRDYGPALPTKLWHELQSGILACPPIHIAMRPSSSSLGLYLASRFADQMHSRLNAIRHHDGTTFFLDLLPSTQTMLPI